MKEKIKLAEELVTSLDRDLKPVAFKIVLEKLFEEEQNLQVAKVPEPNSYVRDITKKLKKSNSAKSLTPIAVNLKGGKGEKSLKDFYSEKTPKSEQEKIITFIHYLNKIVKIENVLPGHIISCYNEVSARKPLNIPQVFRDITRYKGWIDLGSEPGSVKINISGENFVEHDLPKVNK